MYSNLVEAEIQPKTNINTAKIIMDYAPECCADCDNLIHGLFKPYHVDISNSYSISFWRL